MAYDITTNMREASETGNIQPNIILEIDGVSTVFGAISIKKYIRIGDADLEIGDDWIIGGFNEVEDQSSYISFQQGTSTTIKQTLYQDKGKGESISSLQVAVVDVNETVSNLISPGQVVDDILGRRCRIWLGFENTAYPDDYIVVFRGVVESVKSSPGLVTFNISHPDKKKQSEILIEAETTLSSGMGAGDTVANVVSTSEFLDTITGPGGSTDATFETYIKINSEVIRYEGSGATQFSSLTRGALGTVAASHSSGDTVSAFIRINGTAINDVALKLMLSGWAGPFEEDVTLTHFNRINETDTLANTISFQDTDLVQLYNIQVGDYITTTGATNGANNVTNQQITAITENDFGTYITVSGVSFVEEIDSSAVIDFRSQYDVYPIGLKMHNDEVDIQEHQDLHSNFLSNWDYDFYIDSNIDDAKEWLSEQVYNPASAYNIPRKAQASVGYHIGPLPTENIKTLNIDNVLNVGSLKIQRSTSKNFYNAVVYRYENTALDTGTFTRGTVTTDATSLSQIPVGNKALKIDASGMREGLQADANAASATSRRLRKYKFGAEYVVGLKLNFATGFDIEIGDILLVDFTSLKLTDIKSGTRSGDSRLCEITNKSINIKTGEVMIDIVDTNFSNDTRYCLQSPSSLVKVGVSTTEFTIKAGYSTERFGDAEYKKWEKWVGASIVVRSADYVTSDTALIQAVTENTITLASALSFTPSADYIMELDVYDNQPANIKLVYGFMSDGAAFADGGIEYMMI